MDLASVHRKKNEIIEERNQALSVVEDLELNPLLVRYLREQVYQFYKPELEKLELQFNTIQEFIMTVEST